MRSFEQLAITVKTVAVAGCMVFLLSGCGGSASEDDMGVTPQDAIDATTTDPAAVTPEGADATTSDPAATGTGR